MKMPVADAVDVVPGTRIVRRNAVDMNKAADSDHLLRLQ
jgi:hypothetical protein